MNNVKRKVFKNGLRALFVKNPKSATTTVAVIVGVGSDFETRRENGISHFLEHMCFKGTKKRPTAFDVARELDSLGASYNAFTGHEYTSYYAKVQNKLFTDAFDVVSDIYLNPAFNKKEIEKEKGVIIEEVNMYEDLPNKKVQSSFLELMYGDQPAGWSILGTKKNIKAFSRDNFSSYHNRHYTPSSTVVFVSGNFNEDSAVKMIKSQFGNLEKKRVIKKIKVKEAQKKPRELIEFKKSDQTHFVVGFRAFSLFDKRRYALAVLSDVLGGGMSSRLFQKVRDELGAAYYVYSAADLFSDRGVFYAAAGVGNDKTESVIKAILGEFKDMRDNGISKEELQKAKNHITGKFSMALETSDEMGYFYGMQEVLGEKLVSPEEEMKRIRAVSLSEVKSVACHIIKNENLNLTLIGPFKKKTFGGIVRV